MAVEQDILTELNSLFTGGLYLEKLPRNPVYPCGVLTRIGTNPNRTLSGHVERESAFFQLDIYAVTPTAKQTIVDTIRAAMESATSFNAIFADQQSINYDEDIPIFRESLDFTIWYDYII